MIVRLRMLSPVVRYLVYIAGALLLFLVALGVGMTAAAVVGWQSGQSATNATGSGTAEPAGTTMLERTSRAGEGQTAGSPGGTGGETAFVHRATDKNSRGDYTYLSDPDIEGDPNAIVLVTQATGQEGGEKVTYPHVIGVWYTPVAHKWAIFNQDLAAVPAGSTFEVAAVPDSTGFVHEATPSNTAGSYTYLDNRLTNGNPDAVISVTQNWNPGGGRGVYNNHPAGATYDAGLQQWAIYNRDGARMPKGASFNVAVS